MTDNRIMSITFYTGQFRSGIRSVSQSGSNTPTTRGNVYVPQWPSAAKQVPRFSNGPPQQQHFNNFQLNSSNGPIQQPHAQQPTQQHAAVGSSPMNAKSPGNHQMPQNVSHSRTQQQQQAYLQHLEVIQQHKAVEAHQRYMAQRNEMISRQQQQQQHIQLQHPMSTQQPQLVQNRKESLMVLTPMQQM
eukprot:746306-Hanusia_phi.AAC.2